MAKLKNRPVRDSQMPLILAIAGGLVLIVFILIMLPNDNSKNDELQKQIQILTEGLKKCETRLIDLEKMTSPSTDLEPLQNRLENLEVNLPLRLENIEKKLDVIQKKRVAKPRTVKTKVKSKTAVYHQVKAGETLFSISQQYKVNVKTLIRINKLSAGGTIQPSQKLLIKAGN